MRRRDEDGMSHTRASTASRLATLACLAAALATPLRAGPPVPELDLDEVRQRQARGFQPDRSASVFFVNEPGVFFTEDAAQRNHGSAYAHDVEVPLFLYGPGQVRRGSFAGRSAQSFDVPVTLAHMMGIPPPPEATGRVLAEALAEDRPPLKAALVVMMDQVGQRSLALHPRAMPTLYQLRAEGADFGARNLWLPSVTAAAHAGVGTGAPPSVHGITSNVYWQPGPDPKGMFFTGPDDAVADDLRATTLAEWMDPRFGNRPVVLSLVYARYAAIAMAGRGARYPGGDRDIVLWYDTETGSMVTDPTRYRRPDYLEGRDVSRLLAAHGGALDAQFVGHPEAHKSQQRRIRAHPSFARWHADMALEVMIREGVGRDDAPDLVMVNLKSTDSVGHTFGQEHPNFPACLRQVDRFLERATQLLDRRAGPGQWVLAVTADHGLVPDQHRRRVSEELLDSVGRRLDAAGDRDGHHALDFAFGYGVYLDHAELEQDGATPADVARLLAEDPDVRAAWTAQEVAATAASMGRDDVTGARR